MSSSGAENNKSFFDIIFGSAVKKELTDEQRAAGMVMGLNGPVYQADLEFLGASPGNGRISSSDYPATPIFDHYSTSQRREHHGNHDAPYGDGRLSSADYPVTLFDSPHTLPPEDSSSTLSNRSTAREAEISIERHVAPAARTQASACRVIDRQLVEHEGAAREGRVTGDAAGLSTVPSTAKSAHSLQEDNHSRVCSDTASTRCLSSSGAPSPTVLSGDEDLGMLAFTPTPVRSSHADACVDGRSTRSMQPVGQGNSFRAVDPSSSRANALQTGKGHVLKMIFRDCSEEDSAVVRRSGQGAGSTCSHFPSIDNDRMVGTKRYERQASNSSVFSEDGAAGPAFLQKVVKQLESADPQQAFAAAAALEYLVSSSDPNRERRRDGLLSDIEWRWSADGAKANRRTLGTIPDLWRNLLGLLTKSGPATQAQVCGAMSKLGFRNSKNVLEMMKYPMMLTALTELLDMDKHPQDVVVQALRVFQNFVSGMEEIKVLLCSTEHLLMLIKEACTREGVSSEVRMRAVSVIMHASSSDEARLLLVKARVAEEALQVVMSADIKTEKEEATRIRATLASANLCGREERSFLSTAPEMLRAIGEIIWHAFHGTEYFNIKWSLAGVMLPLFNLSCSDSNKRVLSQCGTVSLLLKAIGPGAEVLVGRNHDVNAQKVEQQDDWSSETLELILRTLANFTFDADAKDQMLQENAHIILKDVLSSLSEQYGGDDPSAGASQEWVSGVKILLKDILFMLSQRNEDMITETRLQTREEAAADDDDTKPDYKAQHIMISYSWAQGKDFVVEVSAGLRKNGFDVWRDEEGSHLVRKMMGSSMEIMAEAIECAEVVVIFVSRAYRDSYNCKLEGRYAQVRERAGLTKILFVMMEEDYTPEANGGVDGWLGMLIGDHIYYPGWDPDQLDETVAELSKSIWKMRKDKSNRTNTIELSQGQNVGPKAPERPLLGDSELEKSAHRRLQKAQTYAGDSASGRRDVSSPPLGRHLLANNTRLRDGGDMAMRDLDHALDKNDSIESRPRDQALDTPPSLCTQAGPSSEQGDSSYVTSRHRNRRRLGAPVWMGSTSKSESKLSTVDESGHKKGAGTHLNEIEVENKGSEDGIELSEACPVSLFHAEAGAEEAAETKQEQTDEEDVDGKQLGLDANKSDSSQPVLQVLEMQGDLEPCETVDDFLDVYGLWDMRDEFDYHRIDDIEIVLRLTRDHIARLTDRVGMQVRLEDAVMKERQLCGLSPYVSHDGQAGRGEQIVNDTVSSACA